MNANFTIKDAILNRIWHILVKVCCEPFVRFSWIIIGPLTLLGKHCSSKSNLTLFGSCWEVVCRATRGGCRRPWRGRARGRWACRGNPSTWTEVGWSRRLWSWPHLSGKIWSLCQSLVLITGRISKKTGWISWSSLDRCHASNNTNMVMMTNLLFARGLHYFNETLLFPVTSSSDFLVHFRLLSLMHRTRLC